MSNDVFFSNLLKIMFIMSMHFSISHLLPFCDAYCKIVITPYALMHNLYKVPWTKGGPKGKNYTMGYK